MMRWAKKLVVMDVDSTLIQQEVIELLGAKAGKESEIREITESAMRGELDFEASLRARVSLLGGLPVSVLDEVRSEIALTPGARTLVSTLQKLGHSVAVVSGGFTAVIEPLLKELNISHYRANTLESADGKLTGKVLGQIVDKAAKAQSLLEWAERSNFKQSQTVAVGDGANDLEMMSWAGLSIAFNAKPIVRATADIVVERQDLLELAEILGV